MNAELLSQAPWLFYAVMIGLGLLVGSFLNVVIYRLPIMLDRAWQAELEDWQTQNAVDGVPTEDDAPVSRDVFNLAVPRSACPHCQRPIRAIENVPVLSWLALRGRCAGCRQPISLRYPFVEALTGALTAWVVLHFGISAEAIAGTALVWALIALCGIDIDHQLLPDIITLPLMWLGLFLSLFHDTAQASTLFIAPRDAIIGALAGYLTLWSVYQLFRLITGKEGMGYGDFKLLAALGAWLGWQMLPLIIMLSAALGAAYGLIMMLVRRDAQSRPMPFGPWLAAAGFVALLYGNELWQAYLSISGL